MYVVAMSNLQKWHKHSLLWSWRLSITKNIHMLGKQIIQLAPATPACRDISTLFKRKVGIALQSCMHSWCFFLPLFKEFLFRKSSAWMVCIEVAQMEGIESVQCSCYKFDHNPCLVCLNLSGVLKALQTHTRSPFLLLRGHPVMC